MINFLPAHTSEIIFVPAFLACSLAVTKSDVLSDLRYIFSLFQSKPLKPHRYFHTV
jgi:hypothetical protein